MQRMRQKKKFVKIVLIAAILVMGGGINVAHANLADSAVNSTNAIRSQALSQMNSGLALYYDSFSYVYSAYTWMVNAEDYAYWAWYYAFYTATGTYAYYAYYYASIALDYYDTAAYYAWLAYYYNNRNYTYLALYFGAVGDYYCAVAELYAAWGS